MRAARNCGLIRALALLRLLEHGGHHTLPALAALFKCHPRTIRRDLYALEEEGYPIGHDDESEGPYPWKWWLA